MIECSVVGPKTADAVGKHRVCVDCHITDCRMQLPNSIVNKAIVSDILPYVSSLVAKASEPTLWCVVVTLYN